MDKLHISVAAETIFHLGRFTITNSLLTSLIITIILFFLVLKLRLTKTKKQTNIYFVTEMLIECFYNFFEKIAGNLTIKIFPVIFTFFIFIILSNWVGLIPGVGSIGIWEEREGKKLFLPLFRGPNADLNTTLALALISVFLTQTLSIKAIGIKNYFNRFINFTNPLKFFVGILEIVQELAKILSFSFRLFGNIFAGEVLLLVMTFLIPLIVPVPFLFLEIFVGFIQALVFTMLTTIFIVVSSQHE